MQYTWSIWRRFLISLLLTGLASLFGSSAALAHPQRIVEGWYAHNATLLMLGAGPHIVATVARPDTLPWMFKLFPELEHAQILPSARLNGEQLLTLHPDLVFIPKGESSGEELKRLGLSVDAEGFDSFSGLLASVNHTADLLGTPLAKQRAAEFEKAVHQQLGSYAQAPAEHAPQQQGASFSYPLSGKVPIRVLHIESITPLLVDGRNTIIDQWIRSAGGVNVAHSLDGNKRPVSIEQLLAWQPQVIIVGDTAGALTTLENNPLWQQIVAVRTGRVIRNPGGIFPWDRYGPELLLQLEWAHELLRDGKIDKPVMIGKIMGFYHKFYGVALKRSDAERILQGQPPAAERF